MCAICGCSSDAHHPGGHGPHAHGPGHEPHHEHEHEHAPHHEHEHVHAASPAVLGDGSGTRDARARTIRLEQEVLARNDRIAAECRAWLAARGVVAINVLSSPGSGKTTLLERTLRDQRDQREDGDGGLALSVIEGDQETARDADRIRAADARVVQINTGTGCHLDARMVLAALPELDPAEGSLVVIENVGNLVCPALFDLGERAKVVVFSVTEGDDKPLKYPHMFRACDAVVLSKIDLAPYVPFDRDRFVANALSVNPRLEVIELSATRGDGMDAWYTWLRRAAFGGRGPSGSFEPAGGRGRA